MVRKFWARIVLASALVAAFAACGQLVAAEPLKKEFKVWKTIKIGTGLKTGDDFLKAITAAKMNVNDKARFMLKHRDFKTADKETEIDLVKVTVEELGFKSYALASDIYKRAKELGLELCPSEVGPQLFLNWKSESVQGSISVGMNPIDTSDSFMKPLGVFIVYSPPIFSLALDSEGIFDGQSFGPLSTWVFIRPRKSK